MFGTQLGIVFLYSAIIMLVFMFSWICIAPFKLLSKFLLNVAMGIACISVYNLIGNFYNFDIIGINGITACITGTLGVPGFVAIVVLQSIL